MEFHAVRAQVRVGHQTSANRCQLSSVDPVRKLVSNVAFSRRSVLCRLPPQLRVIPAANKRPEHRRRFAGSRGGVWADGSPCSLFQPESIRLEKRTVVKSLVAFESAHADSRYGQGAVESAKPLRHPWK